MRTLSALLALNLFSLEQATEIKRAYLTLRRVINALRSVTGSSHTLTLPAALDASDELFVALARRLGYL